jgi:acyl-coenzyme A synthetase/AMP-(fatty) acid ligase
MINPIKYLILNAKLAPEKPAIISTILTISFKECLERVQHLAIKFRKLGIKPGQIVVVILEDKTVNWLITLALIHEGVITMSEKYFKLPDELNPDLILCDREPDKSLFKAKHLVLDKTWFAKNENIKDVVPQDYKSEDSLIRILLSSGTTGEIKCIPLTIKNLESRARIYFNENLYGQNIGDFISMFPPGAGPHIFPTFFSYFLNQRPYYDAHDLESTCKLILDYKIENLIGSPNQLSFLIDYIKDKKISITSLKTAMYAGSKVSSVLFENIKNYLCKNIINNYGSTEAGSLSKNIIKHYLDPSFIGRPNVGNKVEIVDELGNVLKNEEEGLIGIKTPYMTTGYYNNEVATKKFFKEGWFYSGDTGYLSNEGELYLTGRNDERINLDGVKINPSKIDEIMESYPDIKEAACFGLLDGKGNHILCAAYVTTQVEFNFEKFEKYLIKQINNLSTSVLYMPKIFIKLNNIPRNTNGKIMRHELSKKYKLSATNQLLELKVS